MFLAGELIDLRPARPEKTGHFFFLDQVLADQEAVQVLAQQMAPFFQDVGKLAVERIGHGDGGAAQHVHEVLGLGPEHGLFGEELAEAGDDVLVSGFLGQGGVVEKLPKRRKSRVHVGQPEHQHLFQGDLAVRHAGGHAVQIGRRVDLPLVDGHGGKPVDETK